jgi:1,4-dihydroxy-2-naphthoate octaprenyltransferase
VNNHRDIAHDRLVGRRTFAVTFGETGSRRLFTTLLFAPFVLVPVIGHLAQSIPMLLPMALVPVAWRLRHDFVHSPRGIAFNDVLFRTFRLELWFAALLSAGALLGGGRG